MATQTKPDEATCAASAASAGSAATDYCDCDCHRTGAIHIEACCEGICEGCQRDIRFGRLSEHRRHCGPWIAWARKQKRDNLRRWGVWADFEAVR